MRRIPITALALALASVAVTGAQQTTIDIVPVQPVATSQTGVIVSTNARDPFAGGRGEAVCVVPSPEIALENLGELAEDLDIMCAVLDRLLGNANIQTEPWAGRINRYRRSVRSIYLPRFGALFFVEVKFPLAPLPKAEEQTEEETTDALWAQVRSNMRSQGLPDRRGPQEVTAQYDELKVESLRRALVGGLRHAGNIRHLGTDEQIVVVALESADIATAVIHAFAGGQYSDYKPRVGGASGGPTRLLSLRATKKDIDALAEGQTDQATFAQRVKTLSYELPSLKAGPATEPMR